jgi:hypothetical protein
MKISLVHLTRGLLLFLEAALPPQVLAQQQCRSF